MCWPIPALPEKEEHPGTWMKLRFNASLTAVSQILSPDLLRRRTTREPGEEHGQNYNNNI
jgi:hypothetical protein